MNPMRVSIPASGEIQGAGRLVEFVLAVVQNPDGIKAGLEEVAQERARAEELLASIEGARVQANDARKQAEEAVETARQEAARLEGERRVHAEQLASLAAARRAAEAASADLAAAQAAHEAERARFDAAVNDWAGQMSREKSEALALRKDAEALMARAEEEMQKASSVREEYESKIKALQAAVGA